MARGPGVGTRAVGSHLLGCVFDTVDEGCHDTIRHGGTSEQTGPVTATFIATQLQTDGGYRAEELQIIVNT